MAKTVVIVGAGGRVGSALAGELLARGHDTVLVDLLPEAALAQRAARLLIDNRLVGRSGAGRVSVHGGVNIADGPALQAILAQAQPDAVVNYAIPITWDATKRLPNYKRISAAGLGAFTPIQVYAPWIIGRAIRTLGIDCKYMVGNLPDITIPVLRGLSHTHRPLCGAGNVGLISSAIRRLASLQLGVPDTDIQVDLVAHHIHWVAPREPGYAQDAPFLLRVRRSGEDLAGQLWQDDGREFMNRAITSCYEPGAGFSSTTGMLAAKVAMALMDESGRSYPLHTPAPEGLPGGYPVNICRGSVEPQLPLCWTLDEAREAMIQAQGMDGVTSIEANGSTHFSQQARDILKQELGFELPDIVSEGDLEAVARAQIDCVRQRFSTLTA